MSTKELALEATSSCLQFIILHLEREIVLTNLVVFSCTLLIILHSQIVSDEHLFLEAVAQIFSKENRLRY